MIRSLLVVSCATLAACASSPDGPGTGGGGGTSRSSAATEATTITASITSTTVTTASTGTGTPVKPDDLVTYLTGDATDRDVIPMGPGLILMGGGTDVNEAYEWWAPKLSGGDIVVLRTSGADGYNDYFYSDIGGCDSVETLMVTTRALADSDYVAHQLAHAEAIFIAGGDQATYADAWKGTRVQAELDAAWQRGALLGGTSAGSAILSRVAFTAVNGSVYSDEALADPYNVFMTLDRDFLHVPLLENVVTDTHFHERDRMGRLLAFVARPIADGWTDTMLGLGIDEATALVVEPTGQATVVGHGAVYAVRSAGAPQTCVAGMPLAYADLQVAKLVAGDAIQLPVGTTPVATIAVAASGGVTVPANPY